LFNGAETIRKLQRLEQTEGIIGGITLKAQYLRLLAPFAASLVLTGFATAQQPAPTESVPVPSGLRSARTAFVSNAGSDSGLFPEPFSGDPDRPYTEFYQDLKTTGQLQLVDDPSAADLVLEVRLNAPNGPQSPNKQNGASDPLPMLRLAVYDRKTHYVLWAFTESVEMAYLQKTHDHNLDDAISRLVADFERISNPPPAAP
jgi:hypothetical protein